MGPHEHDFGLCKQGAALVHPFTVVNTTGDSMEIVELKTSCSCVVPGGERGLRETRIPPHGSLQIPVLLHTNGVIDTAGGRVTVIYERRARTPRNLRIRDRCELAVKATVEPDYRIEPATIHLGRLDGLEADEVKHTIRIIPVGFPKLRIESLHTGAPWLLAWQEGERNESGEIEVMLVVDVSPLRRSQVLHSDMVITTNSPHRPRSIVQIQGEYVAPVALDPDLVLIGSHERGEVTRSISLRTSCESHLVKATLNIPGASCSISDLPPGHEHKVQVVIPEPQSAFLCGEMTIALLLVVPGAKPLETHHAIPIYRFGQQRSE